MNNLPERLSTGHPHDLAAGASASVLVSINGFRDLAIGQYLHELDTWSVIGWNGSPDIVEWWPLPDKGSGTKL